MNVEPLAAHVPAHLSDRLRHGARVLGARDAGGTPRPVPNVSLPPSTAASSPASTAASTATSAAPGGSASAVSTRAPAGSAPTGCASCAQHAASAEGVFIHPQVPPDAAQPLSTSDRARVERVVRQLQRLPPLQALAVLEPIVPAESYARLRTAPSAFLAQMFAMMKPEVVANGLHRLSPEKQAQFLNLSIAGFPEVTNPPLEVPKRDEIVIPPRSVIPERPRWKAPVRGTVTVRRDTLLREAHRFFSFQTASKDAGYSYIDPYIAVGDRFADPAGFNVLVDANYPSNGVKHLEIDMEAGEQVVIRIGVADNVSEPILDLIETLVPYLLQLRALNPQLSVLFRCARGVSRAPTFAMAYYAKLAGTSLDHTLTIFATRRPQIHPNSGFMDALAAYLNAP